MRKIVGITGHANIEIPFKKPYHPNEYDKDLFEKIKKTFLNFLSKEKVVGCSGMARGVDEIFALAIMELNYELIICVPNSLEWHKNIKINPDRGRAQAIFYDDILKYENLKIIIEVPKEPSDKENIFNKRNQSIVDISNEIYSYHLIESLGTMDCIKKAKEKNKYKGNLYQIKEEKDNIFPS